MKVLKQIIGYTLGTVFLSFLAYKFYKSVEDMEAAGLLVWVACVVLLIIFLTIRKVLLD